MCSRMWVSWVSAMGSSCRSMSPPYTSRVTFHEVLPIRADRDFMLTLSAMESAAWVCRRS